jgi:hypothetical protein
MALIQENILHELDKNDFGPGLIGEQLSFFPAIFPFLQQMEELLGKTRPVLAYSIAAAVWAFRQKSPSPEREMPTGILDSLWERLSQSRSGGNVPEVLEELEPQLWTLFLNLSEAAFVKEEWSKEEFVVAGYVYSVVLLALIYAFWPEAELPEVEKSLQWI